MAVRTLRDIQPYPMRHKWTGIKRFKTEALKRQSLRQERPRRHGRPWKWRTTISPMMAREARATHTVAGSLPERIFYQALVSWGFVPDQDFTFQANYEGGRQELGGLVADFLFPDAMIIIQVQSYWHTLTLAHYRRDEDQRSILENMGYKVLEIWEREILNPVELERWIANNLMLEFGTNSLGLYPTGSGYGWDEFTVDSTLLRIEQRLDDILGVLWTLNA